MKETHPEENEIQDYVLDSKPNSEITNHLHDCRVCRLKADQYQQLFADIRRQEKPVFEFNPTELIMPDLLKEQNKFSFYRYVDNVIIISIAIAFVGLIYLLISLLSNTWKGTPAIWIYLILTAFVCMALVFGVDIWKRYKKQISLLDFH